MKKLSELVAYKNELDRYAVEVTQQFTNIELQKITHLVQNDKLNQSLEKLNKDFIEFELVFDQIKQDLGDQIAVAARPWIQESYNMYDKGEAKNPMDILQGRKYSIESAPFQHRLLQYNNWKYPAMIIRPGLDSFVEYMVACDPLYLVDLSHEFLKPSMDRFNERYQSRLRSYVVNEDLDSQILKQLPDSQFGFCVAVNYFNFRPFEIIKKYLEEIYQKLKPGGVFAFTFNDCDRRSAVELVERFYCSYTPGTLIKELILSMGYEIVHVWHNDDPITWIEIRRPGNLKSLRGGQTLAKILPKPVANSK